MNKKVKAAAVVLLLLVLFGLAAIYIHHHNVAVLNPKGMIAAQQKALLIEATLLMLIVVVPVLVLTVVFSWRYREGNRKAKYAPNWGHSYVAEAFWWGIPCVIIAVLAVITWRSSHALNPFTPLVSDKKPLTIQVVALQWKWLFLYPEQGIATVNWVQFPAHRPIHFEITADAPMNSFWIPQLGGQIYAMPAMRSQLYLIADQEGNYRGASSNLSGDGFSEMFFTAKACGEEEFAEWAKGVVRSSSALHMDSYEKLAEPSREHPVASYVLKERALFDWILMKYGM